MIIMMMIMIMIIIIIITNIFVFYCGRPAVHTTASTGASGAGTRAGEENVTGGRDAG